MAANIYTSLEGSPGAIRLLEVLPGSGSDKLNCRLHEATLGPDLSYKALSYVWKNQVDDDLDASEPALRDGKAIICCDGKFLEIGSNLNSALRRLRDKDTIVQLWVDMLCIDQKDVTERNHQVGMMREIYEGSREVVIWLGEWTELRNDDWREHNSDGFMVDLGPRFPDQSLHKESSVFALIRRLAEGMLLIIKGVFQHNDWATTHAVAELERMMDLPWWRRIWVVQETVVSHKATVCYGDMSLPWTTFVQAAANFASERTSHGFEKSGINLLRDPLSNFSRTVLQIEKTRVEWMSPQFATPLSLLRKFRSRESSDKRDKVFALLGLVKTWERVDPLLADYALSTEQVLWRTTVKIVASTQSLSALEGTLQVQTGSSQSDCKGLAETASRVSKHTSGHQWLRQLANLHFEQALPAGISSTSGLGPLPSWVVDWTIPPLPTESERLSHLELFDASAGSSGLVQLHGTSVMEVQGFVVDEIAAFGAELPSSGFARMRASVLKWLELAVTFDQKDPAAVQREFTDGYITEGSSLEAFSKALCGDMVYDPGRTTSIGKRSGAYRRADISDLGAFQEWSSIDLNQNRRTSIIDNTWQSWTDVEANQKVNSLHLAIETSSSGRSFFISKHGYMGVGPATIQRGDLVCIALGSRVPLILRPKSQAVSCQNKKLRVLVRNPDSSKSPKECSECHNQRYTIVGDAYVHGMMDGEIVKAAHKRSKPPISIYLV